ncbi:MAG: glycoside hydrolase family 78 protein [Planctomycetaceae bacterium]|nr:glycoside hydrolase family 78 protein [Planctomycetaceae bacterium]
MRIIWIIFCFLFILSAFIRVVYSETQIVNPKVNRRIEPVGIENNKPVFRWNLDDDIRNTSQKSYRITVAAAPETLDGSPDFWDSGWIESDNCIDVEYAGKELNSSQKYFWNIQIQNNRGQIAKLPKPATFTAGIFHDSQWKAKWITMKRTASEPLPLFRKSFFVTKNNNKTIKHAVVHICGLGHYELRLNGRKIGQSFIDPGWTNYKKTCLYSSYDITNLLQSGENVFGVLLGNGMYNVSGGRYVKFKGSFGLPKLIAQLEITYSNNTTETIITDESWNCSYSPIIFSCVYGGEDFDATRLESGWDMPNFNDTNWRKVILTESPGGALLAQETPPVVVAKTLKPVNLKRLNNGHYLADFGYNFSGRPRILLRGAAGKKVTIKTGELPNKIWQGHSYTYTLAGNGKNLPLENETDLSYNNSTPDKNLELILPKFSYFGFQFLQIEGAVRPEDRTNNANNNDDDLPELVSICADFTTSAAEKVGEFNCSNEMFNEIDAMINRSVQSNLQSVLTDCPHREKLGWLEVSHLMSPSIMSRYDVQNLYRKICRDISEAQLDNGLVPDIAPEYTRFQAGFFESPEWGGAAVIIPYQLAYVYGDKKILDKQRQTMKRYIDYLTTTRNDQGLVKAGLGDWYDWTPQKGHAGYAQLTPRELTATAMLYLNAAIYAKITTDKNEKKTYAKLAKEVKKDYIKSYGKINNTIATNSQGALALSIALKLYENNNNKDKDDDNIIVTNILEQLIKRIEQDQFAPTTGEVTFRYLLETLSESKRNDIIWTILSRTEKPGYGYMLKKLNMKTLSERWDKYGESMNHCMFGHAQEWFSQSVVGIRLPRTSDIFRNEKITPCNYVIAPKPVGDLTSATGFWNSPFGKIESQWQIKNNRLFCRVKIPANLTCNVEIPTKGNENDVALDKIPLKQHKINFTPIQEPNNKFNIITMKLGSGVYEFDTKW